jgi:Flp pilus assembly protein protease CpaA
VPAPWLLPCALQDFRTRRVSNRLTVPLFVLAWPAALASLLILFVRALESKAKVAIHLEPPPIRRQDGQPTNR